MKIAHLTPYFEYVGGLQVCVHNISERHARNGNDVHIFCRTKKHPNLNSNPSYIEEPFFHFKLIQLTYPICKLWIYPYISGLQKRYRFDLWQINGGYPYGAVLADYFQQNSIPSVLRCSGYDIQVSEELNYGVRRNPRINSMITDNYHKYTAVIAITESVRNEYRTIGVPEDRIKLIPNGADIKRISTYVSADNIRKRHNIPRQSKIILTVGRNHPKKGYSYIPKILRKLLEMRFDGYWIVVGKESARIPDSDILGTDRNRLISVEEISFDPGKYDIPSDELIKYYRSADVYAMTSLLETFGIVLIEAMAAGLPIVCFDAPGVRDVMTPECGATCHPGDIKSFAHSIMNIVENQSELNLSEICRKNSKRYSWDNIADQYLSLYESLI